MVTSFPFLRYQMGTALRGKIANEAPVFRNARPDDFWRAEVRLRLGRAPPSFLMTLTSISGELTNRYIRRTTKHSDGCSSGYTSVLVAPIAEALCEYHPTGRVLSLGLFLVNV